MRIYTGSYRLVFISKNYAFKIPNAFSRKLDDHNNEYIEMSYKYFKQGLLSNKKEISNWKRNKDMRHILCPIVFHIFGFLIVMKKANSFDRKNELMVSKYKELIEKYKNHVLLEDIKLENIGSLNNKIVIIDYGGFVKSNTRKLT
jgi:hypothetical protein